MECVNVRVAARRVLRHRLMKDGYVTSRRPKGPANRSQRSLHHTHRPRRIGTYLALDPLLGLLSGCKCCRCKGQNGQFSGARAGRAGADRPGRSYATRALGRAVLTVANGAVIRSRGVTTAAVAAMAG
jgi:hypothetical protein